MRGQADPFLEVFNQPNPNDSCEVRDAAAVSPQAFTLMNSAIDDRPLDRDGPPAGAGGVVGRGAGPSRLRLALNREPTAAELRRLSAYVRDMREYHRGVTPEPVEYPARITRSLVEEFSGKPFEYEEILPVFEDYVPDAKPSDVGPETRALADLCLALLNTHEFSYVY